MLIIFLTIISIIALIGVVIMPILAMLGFFNNSDKDNEQFKAYKLALELHYHCHLTDNEVNLHKSYLRVLAFLALSVVFGNLAMIIDMPTHLAIFLLITNVCALAIARLVISFDNEVLHCVK